MTIPLEQVKANLLADPEVKEAYDALAPSQQVARLRIARELTQAQLADLVVDVNLAPRQQPS
jgi:hypothetical protein